MNDIHLKNKAYGAEIIKGKHFTNYGYTSCVLYLIDSILNKNETIVSVCCEMKGEFDITNVAMSLPTIINQEGIKEKIVDAYSESEIMQLHKVADYLKQFS